jgi:hypothetical protein
LSNLPYDRTIHHPLEKPLADDINLLISELDRTQRFYAKSLYNSLDTFIGNGFKVVAQSPAALAINVSIGLGYQNNPADLVTGIDGGAGAVLGLNDLESYKPMPLLSVQTFAVPAAPGGPNTRVDIIEAKAERLVTNPLPKQKLNTITGAFDPATLNKTLQWALDGRTGTVTSPAGSTAPLSYKVGVVGNPGVAPATTTGYIKIAEVYVGSAVTTIVDANIVDYRPLPGGDKILLLPPGIGQPFQNAASNDFINFLSASVSGANQHGWSSKTTGAFTGVDLPIPLQVGDILKSVTAWFREPNGASEFMVVQLIERSPALGGSDTPTPIGPTKNTGFTGLRSSLVWSAISDGMPYTLLNDRVYQLQVQFNTTSANFEAAFMGAKIIYNRPIP